MVTFYVGAGAAGWSVKKMGGGERSERETKVIRISFDGAGACVRLVMGW